MTHAASGECSSARAVGSRLQQARSFFPTAGAAAAVIVAAAGGAPSGLRRSGRSWRRGGATLRQHLRRRELLRPGRRSRSGCGAPPATRWAALRTPGRVSAGRRWCAARCSPARSRPFQVLEVNQPSWLGVTGPASSGGAPLLRRGAGAPLSCRAVYDVMLCYVYAPFMLFMLFMQYAVYSCCLCCCLCCLCCLCN